MSDKKNCPWLHAEQIKPAKDNSPLLSPIYHSVKYTFDSYQGLQDCIAGKRDGYVYTRTGNPTNSELEAKLTAMLEKENALCFANGAAAIHSVFLHFLKPGDHIISFYETYAPTRHAIRGLMKKFGIEHTFLHVDEQDKLPEAFQPHTKMVHFEPISNPSLRILDLEFVHQTCREKGVLSFIDATFAGFMNPKTNLFDLVCHSLTKYACGYGDTMGGVVAGTNELLKDFRWASMELGTLIDPFAASKLNTSLKSVAVRYEKQTENAEKIARQLKEISGIELVIYPGLEDHPQHALAKKQFDYMGTMISFDLAKGEQLGNFFDNIHIPICASLGSVETLVAPSELFYTKDFTEENKKRAGIRAGTIRLSIGLEPPEVILDDIAQALSSIR